MSQINAIAIIGAGFSGTMVAVHLLRYAQQPLTIYLIESKASQLGRGVAYSTDQDCHLLNVPAKNMSAFPDKPNHFFAWAKVRERELQQSAWISEITPDSFLPRRIYGDYLLDVLAKAEQAAPQHFVHRKTDKVLSISQDEEGGVLVLSGAELRVQKAVLAIGNFPPGDPKVEDPGFYQRGRYFSNPWSSDVLPALLTTQSCLLIGTGLTMVDWAVLLKEQAYQGQIHSISRHGLLPQVHKPYSRNPSSINLSPELTARNLLSQLRQLANEPAYDWRQVVDIIRPITQTLWTGLSLMEQKRFLRHLRTYWDCHRHRLAPAVAEQFQAMRQSGQLQQHTGRVVAFHETAQDVDVLIHRRGHNNLEPIKVEAVVNCSGSESDYRKLSSPLVKDLLQQGLACPDALTLGLDVSADGALIDIQGNISERLFTLGPPLKGNLWETTAVPEIRVQAESLACHLLSLHPFKLQLVKQLLKSSVQLTRS
jgi:uncharacterized NAD(P)/FAD-binding protein YdhS